MKYILYVERIDTTDGRFHTEYAIPLDGCFEEENAICLAKRVKKTLKDNYVVSISRIRETCVGYVVLNDG